MLLNDGQMLTKQLVEDTLAAAIGEQQQKMRYNMSAADAVAITADSVKSDIDSIVKGRRVRGGKA